MFLLSLYMYCTHCIGQQLVLYLALLSCSLCYVKLHVVHVLLFGQIKKEGRRKLFSSDRKQFELSRVYRHIVGHFGDDLSSQSFDWCKTPKLNITRTNKHEVNLNNHTGKPLAYAQLQVCKKPRFKNLLKGILGVNVR